MVSCFHEGEVFDEVRGGLIPLGDQIGEIRQPTKKDSSLGLGAI